MAQRMTLRDRDVRTLLRIAEPDEAAPGPSLLPWSVLSGLQALVGCDAVAFFQLDSDRERLVWGQDLPADLPADESAFWVHYRDCRPCSYPDDSGDLASVTTFSDFYSLRELRATGMYADYLRPAGMEREIMVCLPSPARRTVRLVLFRGPGPDFGERDRALLTLLRPHLHRLHRAGAAADQELTDRQRQLLGLVAAGYTNGQIARRLGLADSTVRKHLENIFDRLQVHSRAAAVARLDSMVS
ncbi:helix-turn-helix transcriptional regulator [Paractinoplanes globisporus]|uniref:LuxR C-terminal-related transcriptional regulator n=1 Tax=Paractinoplanes globisporus TaxID=113565 RepID=A0ABW6WGS2_9ACTN|nr:helix-turn-helix transcriptional regulator [Actinoplanes globisporus]